MWTYYEKSGKGAAVPVGEDSIFELQMNLLLKLQFRKRSAAELVS
jgi:hypothetical protein